MSETNRLVPMGVSRAPGVGTGSNNQVSINMNYKDVNGNKPQQHHVDDQREDDLDGLQDDSSSRGDFMKSTIFGGLDGLNVSFLLIAGAAGGELAWSMIVLIGFSNIVANAVIMGIGEFLSSKAHREFVLAEKRRSLWEFKHYRSNEIDQMVQKFEARGMSRPDAEIVVNKMAQYEDLFVTVMVNEELGFGLPDDDDGFLLKDAFVMCLSYLAFGALPVAVYFGAGVCGVDAESTLALSSLVSACVLFILGAVKSSFNSSVSWVYCGLETLIPGCACAALAYAIARLLGTAIFKLF